MWGAEGPAVGESAIRELAGDRLDHRDVEQLTRVERRQDGGEARGQHGFAGAGRADHQEVVAACGGDLEGAPRYLLATHVGEIRQSHRQRPPPRHRTRGELVAREVVDQRQQACGRDDVDLFAGPGGFRPRGLGADDAEVVGVRRDRRRQRARDRREPPVEAELAERQVAGEGIGRYCADGTHQAQRDGQIVVAALLGQVGGGEVDGDALGRQAQARGDQRRAHPLARFLHRLVGQADDKESRQAGRNLHLHVDEHRIDALKRYGLNSGDHAPSPTGRGTDLSSGCVSFARTFREQSPAGC